jgi:hypothetical protein
MSIPMVHTVTVEHNSIVVTDGDAPKSRLLYYGDGHNWRIVNKCGCALSQTRHDAVAHAVLTHAISLGIPALAVRKYTTPKKAK